MPPILTYVVSLLVGKISLNQKFSSEVMITSQLRHLALDAGFLPTLSIAMCHDSSSLPQSTSVLEPMRERFPMRKVGGSASSGEGPSTVS